MRLLLKSLARMQMKVMHKVQDCFYLWLCQLKRVNITKSRLVILTILMTTTSQPKKLKGCKKSSTI